MDDFIIVAILDLGLGQSRARDHCKVALDRDSMWVEPKLVDQLGNGDSAIDPAVLAIDPD